VVQGAGVAKGTFFAHFKDKDALMDLLIGAGIDQHLDQLAKAPAPRTVEDLVALQQPLLRYMTQERYVFDVILRLSGAAAVAEIGAIATTFGRYLTLTALWFETGQFRQDISAELQAEGMQAFLTQAMALHFCALHEDQTMEARLTVYLRAWLCPGG
jgi:AcrR family transcriptional regulator